MLLLFKQKQRTNYIIYRKNVNNKKKEESEERGTRENMNKRRNVGVDAHIDPKKETKKNSK